MKLDRMDFLFWSYVFGVSLLLFCIATYIFFIRPYYLGTTSRQLTEDIEMAEDNKELTDLLAGFFKDDFYSVHEHNEFRDRWREMIDKDWLNFENKKAGEALGKFYREQQNESKNR